MKATGNVDRLIKASALIFISIVFFYIGKHWSDGYETLTFFNYRQISSSAAAPPSSSSVVAVSPNFNKTFDVSSIVNHTVSDQQQRHQQKGAVHSASPGAAVHKMGVVNENGAMAKDFEVGDFDPNWVEVNETKDLESGGGGGGDEVRLRVSVKKFDICPQSMMDYIPCLDNVEVIKRLNSTEKGEKFERHCPEKGLELNCLVPAPKGYRTKIPWPTSRNEVWFSNVPHARLVEDKGGQNWITVEKDKFKFPGGGTQFIHGADQYLDQIEKMLPEIAFGRHTRVVLDVGCGVASFGAYLLSRNVLPLSIAPKDVHENQIQFALERGVPAMVAAFATRRLLYPSQAFELIHCSRCRVNWTHDDGILLLEVNRMLRAGGYFAWAAQPVYKHEALLEQQWEEMVNLTNRLCWKLVKKEGFIAIWQKPLNHSCYLSRAEGTNPPLCDPDDDPDNVWYVNLKPCITRLPEDGYGANVTTWPARLQSPPDRLQSMPIDAFSSKELFATETKYWNEDVKHFVRMKYWKQFPFRNMLDMRAGFGGFAAAIIKNKLDFWVLNVVPVSGPNTLPIIYDRGLIGVMHDWCEPFDTYPRTYDFLHAAGLFSIERKRCNISTIMLEMDRILRPGGRVYIRDLLDVTDELQEIAKAMGWVIYLQLTGEKTYSFYRVLLCEKKFSHA